MDYLSKMMLTQIHPKLPMRNKKATKDYYIQKLGFEICGSGDYPDYLMLKRDQIEIHFFLFPELNPLENYGQVYIRTQQIEQLYQSLMDMGTEIHPNAPLEIKPWGVIEFSLLDPDNNLLTIGQII